MATYRVLMMSALCAVAVMLGACASAESYVKPGFDFGSVGKVAVITASQVGGPTQQHEIADLFAMHVLAKGYDVIDRANVADLEKEAQFQNESGVTSDEGRAKLALRNVPTVIVANVSRLGDEISMTAKMVDVQSGTILWTGAGEGNLKRGLMPVGGALLGAAGGAVAGAFIGNTRGAVLGGLAGGAAGGVTGAALEPSDVKLLRSVIERTCRGLPPARLQ